jgi:hypothetical protein
MYTTAEPIKKDKPKPALIQRKETPNRTGIPDKIKTHFENNSGLSFDDVRVHFNSPEPAQLHAEAFTEGNIVKIGPGNEDTLLHELGHVVQQKQARVKPTTTINGVAVNDDPILEKEADNIGKSCSVMQMSTEITYRRAPFKHLNPLNLKKGETMTTTVGRHMTAKLDPHDPRRGSATRSTEQPLLMNRFNDLRTHAFVRGHLLNHDLGGLAVDENLFPISSGANACHQSKVETPAKMWLAYLHSISKNQNETALYYDVSVASNFELTTDGDKCVSDIFTSTLVAESLDKSLNLGTVNIASNRAEGATYDSFIKTPHERGVSDAFLLPLLDWSHSTFKDGKTVELKGLNGVKGMRNKISKGEHGKNYVEDATGEVYAVVED